MGRTPCCDKNGLKKGPWTPEEDAKLTQYIHAHGAGNWRNLPKNAGLQRCGKSCRLRWTNYLRPDIKRGRFSFDEEETIIQLHSVLGNKWSAIAARLPGRTDNEIKNYWNTHIRKRLLRMGIDPVTHAPRLDFSSLLNSPQLNLLRLHTLINPEALRLAMTLISSNAADSHLLNSQLAPPQLPLQLPNHFENIIDQKIPPNINNNSQYQQIFHENVMPSFGYQVSDQMRADSSENSSFQSMNSNSSSDNNRQDFSLDSTPLSSPPTMVNSALELIGGSREDERESFCSNLFKFENDESCWDLEDFLQI